MIIEYNTITKQVRLWRGVKGSCLAIIPNIYSVKSDTHIQTIQYLKNEDDKLIAILTGTLRVVNE